MTIVVAALAGIALVLIILIGLSYGASFADLYVMGIALAIAAIPTGMPVVITLILATGGHRDGQLIMRLSNACQQWRLWDQLPQFVRIRQVPSL